ncbi:MAG: hypothetical protein ACOC0E_08335 [Spirochaetota bacterium]
MPISSSQRRVLVAAVALLVLCSGCAVLPPERTAEAVPPAAQPFGSRLLGASRDPSARGPHRYRVFRYASPHNPRRPSYAVDRIELVTRPVDVSAFVSGVDEAFWGYDETRAPLNAIVWMPNGPGPYPLAIIAHGNHPPHDFSEGGYGYLGEHLASHGIAAVSVDENFLNFVDDESDARAVILLEHLRCLHAWTRDAHTPLFERLDLSKIALIGHSRGGSAAVHASIFNDRPPASADGSVGSHNGYAIRAVVALAAVEGRYRPRGRESVLPPDVDYLSIHGTLDGDVTAHLGLRYFYRGSVATESFRVAATLHGANHARFNTEWARVQDPRPTLIGNLLSGREQRRTATGLVTAFLFASFDLRPELRDAFLDPRGAVFLPETLLRTVCRYGDSEPITGFEGGPGLSRSASGWTIEAAGLPDLRKTYLPLRTDEERMTENRALRVNLSPSGRGGRAVGVLTFVAPDPIPATAVLFDLAVEDAGSATAPVPLEVVVRTSEGEHRCALATLYDLRPIPSAHLLTGPARHVASQTIYIPIEAFGLTGPTAVVEVELRLGASERTEVYLDNVRLRS